MTKNDLLQWVQALPDDMIWHPVEMSSLREELLECQTSSRHKAMYLDPGEDSKQTVQTTLDIRVSYKEQYVQEGTRQTVLGDLLTALHRSA